MLNYYEFEALLAFDQDVLDEIVREGEMRVDAQLAVATAADQRSAALLGFQATAASASVAGSFAIALSTKPQLFLVYTGFGFGAALIAAAFLTLRSLRPAQWSFPGNLPENWLHARWNSYAHASADKSLKRATVEQAYCINQAIHKNRSDLERSAKLTKYSVDLTFVAVAAAAALLIYRTFTS